MNNQEQYFNNLLITLGNYALGCSFVILVFSLFFWNNFNSILKLFYYYLLVNLLLNILSLIWVWSVNRYYYEFWKPILDKYQITNNSFFDGFIYLSNFIFIGAFYFKLLNKAGSWSNLKLVVTFVCLFQIINYFYIDGFRTQGIIGPILDGLFLSILPAIYLGIISNNPPNISFQKNSYFIISICLFTTHIISFVFVFVREFINQSNFVLFCKIQIFNIFIIILSQIGFLYAFSKAKYVKYL